MDCGISGAVAAPCLSPKHIPRSILDLSRESRPLNMSRTSPTSGNAVCVAAAFNHLSQGAMARSSVASAVISASPMVAVSARTTSDRATRWNAAKSSWRSLVTAASVDVASLITFPRRQRPRIGSIEFVRSRLEAAAGHSPAVDLLTGRPLRWSSSRPGSLCSNHDSHQPFPRRLSRRHARRRS